MQAYGLLLSSIFILVNFLIGLVLLYFISSGLVAGCALIYQSKFTQHLSPYSCLGYGPRVVSMVGINYELTAPIFDLWL